MEQQAGYRETELGWLPEEWEVVKIGDVFNVQQGKQLSSKENPEGKTKRPFLRTSNVFWQKIDLSKVDEMYFAEDEFQKLKLQNNDILLCEGGDVGRTAVWRNEIKDCAYQNHLHRLRPKTQNYEPDFFVDWMEFAILQQKNYIMSANRTTIPNLSQSRLKRFEIPLPPLPEQRKIAAVLAAVQDARDRAEQVVTALRAFKRSLMQHLFTYGPVPVDAVDQVRLQETEIGLMPEGWEVVKLGDVADIVYGVQAAVAHLTDESKGIPILTNINIKNEGFIGLSTLRYYELPQRKRESLLLKKGDILFNWRSGSKKQVGKTALFNLDGEFTFSSFILRFRTKEQLSNSYLFYYLQYIKSKDFFSSQGGQSSINSVFNASLSAKIPIFLPDLREQHQIADILAAVDAKIEKEQNEKAALDSLFQSMLDALMTAKLRVTMLTE